MANNDKHKLYDLSSKENGDDEKEFMFTKIPIAGEHDDDSKESWESDESEQEEGEDGPYLGQLITNDEATNDIAFRIGPILDGIILQINQIFSIPVTPNYYQSLHLSHSRLFSNRAGL
jgi:hypothetical protein